jgi:hypothetical protein
MTPGRRRRWVGGRAQVNLPKIEKGEFEELKKEGEALWGTLDFWGGTWVPGWLRRELEEVFVRTPKFELH